MATTGPPRNAWSVDVVAPAQDRPEPTTLDYALAYAGLGWHVLPVWSVDANGQCRCGRPNDEKGHAAGKHPHAELAPHGQHNATVDERIIREWWTSDPDAGVGIALAASGLLALDIDPKNNGFESLAAIEAEHGPICSDCTALTQGGGEHRLFVADSRMMYPGKISPGLDLKHHGYICVAPTLGPLGEYTWANGCSPLSKSHPAKPSSLPQFISSLSRPQIDFGLSAVTGAPVATALTFRELRAALKYIDADDYHAWVDVGMALKPYGETGYNIWTEWSATSQKFEINQQRNKWEHSLSYPHSITFRSIFHYAFSNGWSGETAKPEAKDSENTEIHPLSLKKAVTSGASEVDIFEYIYEDFMSTGVNVVAGAPGVGKTTLIVPLALAAAHLCPADYALKPTVRRNVIIITESVIQVRRVIYSLCSWGYTGMRRTDFDERVRIVSANRLDPAIVALVSHEYRTWTVNNAKADGSYHAALPLVVFDTANAVFDLENENDNAEVGRAMAYVKQAFSGFPIIIVSHTAKALGSAESDHLSPRGASAWMGDAQGVYMVFKDGEHADAPRVLKAAKVRFPTAFSELAFDLVSNRECHKDVLGYDKDVWFSHAIARPLKNGERMRLREERREQEEQEEWSSFCESILELVRKDPGKSRRHYLKLSSREGGVCGSEDKKERAFASMLEDGSLESVESEPDSAGRRRKGLRVNEDAVATINSGKFGI